MCGAGRGAENDTAALLQGVKNEGRDFLMAQLRGLAGFIGDALPFVLKFVKLV